MKPGNELTPFQKALLDSVLDSFPDLPENDDSFNSTRLLNKIRSRVDQLPEEQKAWFEGIEHIS